MRIAVVRAHIIANGAISGCSRPHNVYRRLYSNVVSPKIEEIRIPCKSSGHIYLNICHAYPGSSGPIILYLPKGPLDVSSQTENLPLESLAMSSNGTVVQVNFRLDKLHKYPVPVHDVLLAYDWVTRNLVNDRDQVSTYRSSRPEKRHIGVCGELIGGSLATMLALTECHMGKTSIRAAAVSNPLLDWTFPTAEELEIQKRDNELVPRFEGKSRRQRSKKPDSMTIFADSPELNLETLLRARRLCFGKPAQYFDPFASPLLFFRTPQSSLPKPDEDSCDGEDDVDELTKILRKSHRRYPPSGSGLRFPSMTVMVGEDNILLDQASELVSLMQRSIGLYEHSKISMDNSSLEDFDEPPDDPQPAAAGRIQLLRRPGLGLWKAKDMMDLGLWFRDRLLP